MTKYILLLGALLGFYSVYGQLPMLDPSFGHAGLRIYSSDYYGNGWDVKIGPDGKILVGGTDSTGCFIARYFSNGQEDLSFGSNGKARFPFLGRKIELQNDGRITVAGGLNNYSLTRLMPDGAVDTTLNHGSVISANLLNRGNCRGIATQADGKIVIGGDVNYFPTLVRYRPDGTIDSSFAQNGYLVDQRLQDNVNIYSVLLQRDNKILLIGDVYNVWNGRANMKNDFLVMRYNSNGSPDSTFNGTGYVMSDIGNVYSFAKAGILQPDGKIIAAGHTEPIGGDFALLRYETTGVLDTTFGDNHTGVVLCRIDSSSRSDNLAYAVASDINGKITIAGKTRNLGKTVFSMARLLNDGRINTTWGENGFVTTDIGGYDDEINAIATQQDGKVVAVGFSADRSRNGLYTHLVIARYLDVSSQSITAPSIKRNFQLHPNPFCRKIIINAQTYSGPIKVIVSAITAGIIHRGDYIVSPIKPAELDLSFCPIGISTISVIDKDGRQESFRLLRSTP